MKNVQKHSIYSFPALILLVAGVLILGGCSNDAATPTPAPTVAPTAIVADISAVATKTQPPLSQPRDATPEPTFVTGDISFGTPTPNTIITSTGVIVADSGFRPKPDGYSFENYSGRKRNGKIIPELTINDLVRMFGEPDVCVKVVNKVCTPKAEAQDWLDSANSELVGGHCEGMAVSSLALFKGLESPASYADGITVTYQLRLTDRVRSLIAYYYFLQMIDPVATKYTEAEQAKPSEVLDTVIASLQNGNPDPVNLGFYGGEPDGNGYLAGHSITPYSVEDKGNGIFWIHVYDNNWPNKFDAYMVIDRNKETWTYDLSAQEPSQKPEVWTGDAESHTLAALPISVRMGTLICPWCDAPEEQSNTGSIVGSALTLAPSVSLASSGAAGEQTATAGRSSTMQVRMDGDGHLLIKNSKGQRIGYDGTKLVKEIPGARVVVPRGGLRVAVQPVYYLPKGDSYTITMEGQPAKTTKGGTNSVSFFGQGMAITVQDIELNAGDHHEISLSADAQKLSFVAGNSNIKPTFRISTSVKTGPGATAGNPASYLFQVGDVSVTQGQQLDFSLDKPAGQLEIMSKGSTAPVSTYNLDITKSDQVGTTSFQKTNLNLLNNDTHTLNFSDWTTNLDVQVDIDHGSTGTVDDTEAVPTAEPTAEPTVQP